MSAALDLSAVFAALAALPPAGRGQVVAVAAASVEEGGAEVAQALAEAGAARGAALLIDLDLARDHHASAYGAALTATIEGRLHGRLFFDPPAGLSQPYAFRRVELGRLFVGVAAAEVRAAPPALSGLEPYWRAVRRACEVCVVEAPALTGRPDAAAALVGVDAVVLVASERSGSAAATLAARAALAEVGAPLLGLVYTGATAPPGVFGRWWRGAVQPRRASAAP